MTHATSMHPNSPRGFSLIELLLSIFILGIGIISIAAVFPAGIIQQRKTQDDVMGPVVAEAAMAAIRTHLSQADFGTLEEFGIASVKRAPPNGERGLSRHLPERPRLVHGPRRLAVASAVDGRACRSRGFEQRAVLRWRH